MKRFDRVKQILEEAVEGKTIMAHGNFWRDLTLDAFKVKKVFGKLLVTVGNADESNLIKALEGRAPFGSDIGTPGALFKRMPDGFPPVTPKKIAYLRQWITDGCPDEDEPAIVRHNDYWRDFDNWAMFQATQEVQDAIGEFFNQAPTWMAFAKDSPTLSAWLTAISQLPVQQAIGVLAPRILETAHTHYGNPLRLDDILESYELFGADRLPDDPFRPADPRHNMNGEIMWFFYAAFTDANLRPPASPEYEEWITMGRAILIGLLNDGIFRGRFPVIGFTADEAGAQVIRAFVRTLPKDNLADELARRFVDSRLT